jgi:hypothetical protein
MTNTSLVERLLEFQSYSHDGRHIGCPDICREAAQALRERDKRIADLENVLGAVTDELQETIIDDYKYKYGNPVHPAMADRMERDLSTVKEARTLLSKEP